MSTQREKIIKQVRKILKNSKKGIRYADLIRSINEALPKTKINTIHGTIWEFKQRIDKGEIKDVVRPEKGLYILKKYFEERDLGVTEHRENEEIEETREKDFYKLFANYLVNELDECTRTISLGGHKFQDKWGTPDVLGVYRFTDADKIRPTPEIISAEIKLGTNQLITAFGQACAYKLFSHKVYLVIPQNSAEVDKSRIESVCSRFGIGLITFNREDKSNPNFQIRTRAIKSEPDYFYVNEYLNRLNKNDLNELF